MSKKIESIRGMNDILPAHMHYWELLESTLVTIAKSYGYSQIRFPIVEMASLFKRSVGEHTDIVEKEMFTFADRNGDNLTLRPEGTAGCARAMIEHGLVYNQQQRIWYLGPMFRHERPQKGRYRQFYQFGIEAYGFAGPDIDAEIILLSARVLQHLGLTAQVELQINCLGTAEERARYRQQLIAYFQSHENQLDIDSKRRLSVNPLRILDSKNPEMKKLIDGAPILLDYLEQSSQQHFAGLKQILDAAGIAYQVNPRLVRGLDYYSLTVFEWATKELGAQGTVCAGGRYDGLLKQLGGHATPAVGFAMGLERLVALLEMQPSVARLPNAYLIMIGAEANQQGTLLAEQLRNALPNLQLIVNCGDGNFSSQFKRADKSGAELALIIAEDELATKTISVKELRRKAKQISKPAAELAKWLTKRFPEIKPKKELNIKLADSDT